MEKSISPGKCQRVSSLDFFPIWFQQPCSLPSPIVDGFRHLLVLVGEVVEVVVAAVASVPHVPAVHPGRAGVDVVGDRALQSDKRVVILEGHYYVHVRIEADQLRSMTGRLMYPFFLTAKCYARIQAVLLSSI